MGTVNTDKQIQSLKSIQQSLKDLGLYHGAVDGLFGNGSIEAFRRVLGGNIPVADPHTFAAKEVFFSLQTALVAAGQDTNGVDGIWGGASVKAFDNVVGAYKAPVTPTKPETTEQPKPAGTHVFGSLSESRLKGVKPKLVQVVRRALEISPVDFGVREGLRTVEQQRENVRKGVSQTMNSKHITGDAVDLYPTVLPEGWQRNPKVWIPVMNAVKQAGDELGVKLRFGINWKNDPNLPIETKFIDAPHVELV